MQCVANTFTQTFLKSYVTLEIFDGLRSLEGHFLSPQIDGEHEAAEVDRLSGVVEELRGESGRPPGTDINLEEGLIWNLDVFEVNGKN